MTTTDIGFGGSQDGTTVLSGDTLNVHGATVTNTTVNAGGSMDVAMASSGWTTSAGSAVNTTVQAGGSALINSGSFEIVSAGQDTGVTIGENGKLIVENGGTALADTILADGSAIVSAGGTTTSNSIYGSQIISSGGTGNQDIVENGGNLLVSGGTVSGTEIESGGTISVLNGGWTNASAINLVVDEGATADIGSGGVAIIDNATVRSLTINGNGSAIINAGGIMSDATINGGGSAIINASGIISGGTLSGTYSDIYVSAGGIASGVTVENAGVLSVYTGGSGVANTIEANASAFIANGGVTSNNIIYGSQTMSAGASGFADTVEKGGKLWVSGAVISNTQIDNGGIVSVTSSGSILGSATNLVVNEGATAEIDSGGVAIADNATVQSLTINGGSENVLAGGIALSNTISNGGQVTIQDGGLLSGGMAQDTNTTITVLNGGVAASATIQSNAALIVSAGGSAQDNVLSNNASATILGQALDNTFGEGARATISKGGLISGGTLSGTYSDIYVSAGGIASGVNVESAGVLSVYTGGSGVANTIEANASAFIANGGVTSNNIIYGSQTMSTGASGFADTVEKGGQLWVSGAVISNTQIDNGGTLSITSGDNNTAASAVELHVNDGGSVVVSAGGNVTNIHTTGSGSAVFTAGASLTISEDSDLTHVSLQNGASATLTDKAQITGLSVLSGVTVDINSGATTTSALVSGYHAILNVAEGGSTTGTILSGTSDRDHDGVESVLAGGSTSNTQVDQWGIQVVEGGTALNTTVSSGGELDVHDGNALSALINDGGSANISGGSATDWNINDGGIVNVSAGGTIINAHVNTGGSVNVYESGLAIASSGVLSGVTLSGGDVYVSAGGIAVNTTVVSSGQVIVDNGGSAVASGTSLANVTVHAGGTLVVDGSESDNSLTTVTNASLESGSYLLFPELTTGDYSVTVVGNTLDVMSGGKTVASVQLANNDYNGEGDSFTIVSNTSGSAFEVIVCFLTDSMIATPHGEIAVQNLQIGEEIYVYVHNQSIIRKIKWAGHAHTTVKPELPDDEAGWPVRILKDAIADGVPYKDMLITAEHCLFFDGKFIPARMLVNGRSIFYDKSITSYDYYHIETEQHSVIMADGVLTESYLDTGNRHSFRQKGTIIQFGGKTKTWEKDASVPLCVEQSFSEPLFHAIEQRADSVEGAAPKSEPVTLIYDPDVYLLTQSGQSIRPMRHQRSRYSFLLPPRTTSVRIMSRANRPFDVIGPFVDDRRYMGVAVADIHLCVANSTHLITSHLQSEKPDGWYETDWTDCAWTNGNAFLPLESDQLQKNMGLLSLTIRAAGPYVAQDCIDHKKSVQSA
ncbi:Hint domain-containing protein [Acetobacter sp. AAB5]|uniref:Hint domain-containing protein n=1 Tax=Acetobacter sp. AAB5 TaxID=3418370 RepID=UPI003CF0AF24